MDAPLTEDEVREPLDLAALLTATFAEPAPDYPEATRVGAFRKLRQAHERRLILARRA